jgi:hypothetical protein
MEKNTWRDTSELVPFTDFQYDESLVENKMEGHVAGIGI